jgi:hypothetical protein
VTPVFVLKASSTFWKASCSLPPQSDMTVIVLPAAADPAAEPDGVVVPGLCEHAVATSRATKATMANGFVDRAMTHLPVRTSTVPRRPGEALARSRAFGDSR